SSPRRSRGRRARPSRTSRRPFLPRARKRPLRIPEANFRARSAVFTIVPPGNQEGDMRRFSRLGVAALLAAGLAAAAAWGAAARTAAKVPASCNGLVYAHMGPLTGANAVLGQEQLTSGKFELAQFNATHHTNFKIFEADDQLSAAQGSTLAQQIVSNPAILAVVGPAGSQV